MELISSQTGSSWTQSLWTTFFVTLLTDIKSTDNGEFLKLHTLAGTLDSDEKEMFGDFDVWYKHKCLSNILSLALVTNQFRVTMDTAMYNTFNVHIFSTHVIKFERVIPGFVLV